MGTGRPTDAELRDVRGRVEELMLAGLKPAGIRRALTSLALSEQSVERHCRAVREGWRSRNADIETERAEVIAQVREAARVAVSRATLHSKSNLGVGYLNVLVSARVFVGDPSRTQAQPAGAPFSGRPVWCPSCRPHSTAPRLPGGGCRDEKVAQDRERGGRCVDGRAA
jgi:hypothetical protein